MKRYIVIEEDKPETPSSSYTLILDTTLKGVTAKGIKYGVNDLYLVIADTDPIVGHRLLGDAVFISTGYIFSELGKSMFLFDTISELLVQYPEFIDI